jgi:tetratricopeptide (TPR) repeat protein
MRRRSAALGVAALALAALSGAGPAAGDRPAASAASGPERQAGETFWGRVAHPNRAKVRALIRTGRELVDARNWGTAVEILEEAAALDPTEPEAPYWLAKALIGQARWGDCAEVLGILVQEHPGWAPPGQRAGRAQLDFEAGLCLALGGRVAESVGHYRRVLAAETDGIARDVVHWNLGDSLQALGRLEEAIAEYRRGLALKPQHAMLRFALGVAYDRDEQVAKAHDAIREGLELDRSATLARMSTIDGSQVLYLPPEDEDYYRGLAHKVAGRRSFALVHLRRYLYRAPDSPWARRAKEHLAELGLPAIGDGDVEIRALEGAARGKVVKGVLASAPGLQRCLEGLRFARIVVEITVPASRPPRPPARSSAPKGRGPAVLVKSPGPPSIRVVSEGPVPSPREAIDCVTREAAKIPTPPPAERMVVIRIPIIAL